MSESLDGSIHRHQTGWSASSADVCQRLKLILIHNSFWKYPTKLFNMNKTIRWTSGKNKGSLKDKYQHCQNYYINLHERTRTAKIVKSSDTGKKSGRKKKKKKELAYYVTSYSITWIWRSKRIYRNTFKTKEMIRCIWNRHIYFTKILDRSWRSVPSIQRAWLIYLKLISGVRFDSITIFSKWKHSAILSHHFSHVYCLWICQHLSPNHFFKK